MFVTEKWRIEIVCTSFERVPGNALTTRTRRKGGIMVLIFGGAFQGKLDYARENFPISTVCDCSDGKTPDFTKDAIYGIEKFVLRCAREGSEAADFFRKHRTEWQEKVLIISDVSQGIVPMDATLRAFREMNGRLMLYLAGEAEQIIRVFCGIGKKVE